MSQRIHHLGVVGILFFIGFENPLPLTGVQPPTPAAIEEALNSLRTGSEATDDAQTDAIGLALDHPEPALEAFRSILGAERIDSRFAIGTAGLFLTMSDYSDLALIEAARHLNWVDPNTNPNSFFSTAFQMAKACPRECAQTIVRMLLLEELAFPVHLHAMTIDRDLGLQFVLGQAREHVLDLVVAELLAPTCQVQRNAAFSLVFLLPAEAPTELLSVASGGNCEESRMAALTALGSIDPPNLPRLASQVILDDTCDSRCKKGMARALALSFNPGVVEPLRRLASDGDSQVRELAAEIIEHLQHNAPEPSALYGALGSASKADQASFRAALETASVSDRFSDALDLIEKLARLGLEDLTLVHRARSAVLGRLSDECLYEYRSLTYLARTLQALRHVPVTSSWEH